MEYEASGIQFVIDHYWPRAKHPELENDYNNLMWSCQKCNRYKSDFAPDEEQIQKGISIIRPDEENPDDHYELRGYCLTHKTLKGEFNINLLILNRKQLRIIRELRERLWNANKYIAFGLHHIANVRLDKITPKNRPFFLKLRKSLNDRDRKAQKALKEVVGFARSPLLDEDPQLNQQLKARKKYLDKWKALGSVLLLEEK